MKAQPKKPTVIIFDMDGTTVRHVNPAFLHALEMIDNVLYRITTKFKRKRKLQDYSRQTVIPRGLLVHRILHKFRRKSVEQIVQPCPGIYSVLKFLSAHNIPVGLASNGIGKGYGHDIIEKFALDPYFNAEIFAEDVQKSKPHPDGLMRCLRALKPDFTKDDVVWHIGDRAKDVTATMNANKIADCTFVPFSYGPSAALMILKVIKSTDNIIVTYPEFLEKLTELLGEPEDASNQRNISNSAS